MRSRGRISVENYVPRLPNREVIVIMSVQAPTSDSGLLDLLRITGPLGVSELADAMEVTPTAVRQRLMRLMARKAIQREATRHGRGRPKHRYWLTDNGLRLTGSNFTDLAVALWQETCQTGDRRRTAGRRCGGSPGRWRPATPTRFRATRRPSGCSRWPTAGAAADSRFGGGVEPRDRSDAARLPLP